MREQLENLQEPLWDDDRRMQQLLRDSEQGDAAASWGYSPLTGLRGFGRSHPCVRQPCFRSLTGDAAVSSCKTLGAWWPSAAQVTQLVQRDYADLEGAARQQGAAPVTRRRHARRRSSPAYIYRRLQRDLQRLIDPKAAPTSAADNYANTKTEAAAEKPTKSPREKPRNSDHTPKAQRQPSPSAGSRRAPPAQGPRRVAWLVARFERERALFKFNPGWLPLPPDGASACTCHSCSSSRSASQPSSTSSLGCASPSNSLPRGELPTCVMSRVIESSRLLQRLSIVKNFTADIVRVSQRQKLPTAGGRPGRYAVAGEAAMGLATCPWGMSTFGNLLPTRRHLVQLLELGLLPWLRKVRALYALLLQVQPPPEGPVPEQQVGPKEDATATATQGRKTTTAKADPADPSNDHKESAQQDRTPIMVSEECTRLLVELGLANPPPRNSDGQLGSAMEFLLFPPVPAQEEKKQTCRGPSNSRRDHGRDKPQNVPTTTTLSKHTNSGKLLGGPLARLFSVQVVPELRRAPPPVGLALLFLHLEYWRALGSHTTALCRSPLLPVAVSTSPSSLSSGADNFSGSDQALGPLWGSGRSLHSLSRLYVDLVSCVNTASGRSSWSFGGVGVDERAHGASEVRKRKNFEGTIARSSRPAPARSAGRIASSLDGAEAAGGPSSDEASAIIIKRQRPTQPAPSVLPSTNRTEQTGQPERQSCAVEGRQLQRFAFDGHDDAFAPGRGHGADGRPRCVAPHDSRAGKRKRQSRDRLSGLTAAANVLLIDDKGQRLLDRMATLHPLVRRLPQFTWSVIASSAGMQTLDLTSLFFTAAAPPSASGGRGSPLRPAALAALQAAGSSCSDPAGLIKFQLASYQPHIVNLPDLLQRVFTTYINRPVMSATGAMHVPRTVALCLECGTLLCTARCCERLVASQLRPMATDAPRRLIPVTNVREHCLRCGYGQMLVMELTARRNDRRLGGSGMAESLYNSSMVQMIVAEPPAARVAVWGALHLDAHGKTRSCIFVTTRTARTHTSHC
eukprot:GHVT01087876.1.p1 GENE.GHVT01087876.1~~GHVT01087876.1.p1  ORF type:complete len:1022 (+),score=182.91 GHVT01087876.1:386-3451(+)